MDLLGRPEDAAFFEKDPTIQRKFYWWFYLPT
jgi:hypothetical protein